MSAAGSDDRTERDDRDSRSPPPSKEVRTKPLDESSRLARWSSLLKSKLSFGFHHLSPAHLPSMTEERRGYALCFEKIANWRIPDSVLKAFGRGDYEIILQLSLSFYHLNSASFFGTTWLGPPISLGNSGRNLPESIDFEYADVVYLISRITDPTCVAVVEIVVSKYDTVKDLVAVQFGCGWTMINIYSKPYPVDIADDADRNNLISCSIFAGSPRDLVIHPDMKSLTAHLKEVPGCALFLKIYSHRQILRAQRYIADNEAIGRYDHVAGLLPQTVVPSGETRNRSIPCIGSEEFLDPGKALHTLPASVKLVTSMDVHISNCQVFIPKREALELRMIDSLFTQYRQVSRTEIQVLKRTLKVGFHNGHSIVNGHWSSQPLQEIKDDLDMLQTADESFVLPNYVPDAYMALVFVVEYELGVQPSRNNHIDSHSILEERGKRTKILSITTIGIAVYIPCDGKRILLTNTQRPIDEPGVNVEVKLFKDELCNMLNPTHIALKGVENGGQQEGGAVANALGDAKLKDRLSYIAEDKLRGSTTNLRSSTATENLNLKADVPNNLGAMVGLDIKLTHPKEGVITDGAYIEDLLSEETSTRRPTTYDDEPRRRPPRQQPQRDEAKESISSFKPRSSRGNFREDSDDRDQARRPRQQDRDSNDEEDDRASVAESVASGASERSQVRLSSMYYAGQRKPSEQQEQEEEPWQEDYVPRRREVQPSSKSDLLLHSMHAKLTSPGAGGAHAAVGPVAASQGERDFLTPQEQMGERFTAMKSFVPMQRNEFFIRPMTRGAKTRLNRHGIADVVQDSADYFLSQQQEQAYKTAHESGYQSSIMKRPGAVVNNFNANYGVRSKVDIIKEAEDERNINEINIQFVAFRAQGEGGSKASDSSFVAPRAIYCTFQIYACQPTRTEVLRLQPADPGAVHVLSREEASVRNEPPLVLRYVIDLSRASAYEAYEYAEYLARKSLYVDVWDADSLLYIGTVGIPCRLLMRQESSMVKHALEVDIINGEASVGGNGGVTNMVVLDNGPLVGERVGSLNVMLSCQGVKGRTRKQEQGFHRRPDIQPPIEGLNWRAHSVDHRHPDSTVTAPARPKNRVRARPLTETAPELSEALTSLREQVKGTSFRSLAGNRGHSGLSTLNYDEVVILFKRFAGDKKGSVQYSGELMTLMDLPSMTIMMKKLIKAQKTFGDQTSLRREMLRHANSAEELSDKDLEEFFRVIFEKTGIKSREEDRMLLSRKIVDLVGTDNKYITASKMIKFMSDEADKLDWSAASTRLTLCTQRATLQGVDIEQMLSDYDKTNSKYISVKHFKEFLSAISVYGKLSYPDIQLAVRIFSRHGRGIEDRAPVSLEEVLAFLGINYVGNLQARVHNAIQAQSGDRSEDAITSKYVLRLLNDGQEGVSSSGKFYSYDQVISAFRSLGIFNVLSHEQVMSVLKKLDVKNLGKLSAEQVLGYLGLPLKASELQGSNAGDRSSSGISIEVPSQSSKDQIFDAEQLLKLLLDKVQSNGVAVDEAFRHFDTNGDGFISPTEFEQGLSQLAIFDHIPNWKGQLQQVISKFDKSNDGMVSLREFFAYLGVKDYAPNIVQRLTKIFAVATLQGLSFQDIFAELDENKDGTLDAKEIILGLQKLGTFGDISDADAQSVVKIFDDNGDAKISLQEFVAYFQERVVQDLKLRKIKNGLKVAKRFRDVMQGTQSKGASLRDLFGHFDKDGGGSISVGELEAALKKLPNFKSLSAQDIHDLLQAIDVDNSGDVTFAEFEAFVLNGRPPSEASGAGGEKVTFAERIRETFAAAELKGLSFEQAFKVIDKDGNSALSLEEFDGLLRKMPTFRDIPKKDVREVFEAIDRDGSKTITIDEFKAFVKAGHKELMRHKENLQSIANVRSYGQDALAKEGRDPDSFSRRVHSKEDARDLFIRHLRRISEIDGSLRGLLAYLDDDEDGLIRLGTFFNLLRREDVFESISKAEVEDMLQPFLRDDDYIVVVPFLKWLEGDGKGEGATGKRAGGRGRGGLGEEEKSNYLYDDDLDRAIQENNFGFSRDPEVRAVEKKLRALGRVLAKKGVDVEQRFQHYDSLHTGCVSRTDFIQVLSHLGIYLLEEGKILQENALQAGGQGSGADSVKRLQIEQINRLKGYPRPAHGTSAGALSQGYVHQIPALARKLFQDNGGGHRGRVQGGGQEFKNHLESLTVIDWYRQGQKQMLLQRVLSHSLAHTIHLYPRFGKTLFFEYPLSNPFNHEERFEIEINDPELRLVTSMDEWQYLRGHCSVCVGELGPTPPDTETFDRDGLGRAQITLLPMESFSLPFTFMTLLPYPSTQSLAKQLRRRGRGGQSREDSKTDSRRGEEKDDRDRDQSHGDDHDDEDEEDDALRVIEVKLLSATHGHLVSILRIHLHIRPNFVHRVFRFQEYENTIAKRQIKLIAAMDEQSFVGDFHRQLKYIHCVESTHLLGQDSGPVEPMIGQEEGRAVQSAQENSRVVVEWGPMQAQDNVQEDLSAMSIFIRYKCRQAPTAGMFYLLIYNDPYQSVLHEVWQVIVYSRLRLDVQSLVRSPTAADLVVRGDRYSRRVRAYASHANCTAAYSIDFKPENVFTLVPGAYNRVMTVVQPKQLGGRRALINLVDVDSRELVSTWLLNISATAPAISRVYEVVVSPGNALHKKILFKNPWDVHRKFLLLSSDETLMRPRVPVVEVAPHSGAYLRLWFSAWTGPADGTKEVHLFLNDAGEGQNEECHLFRIRCATP